MRSVYYAFGNRCFVQIQKIKNIVSVYIDMYFQRRNYGFI